MNTAAIVAFVVAMIAMVGISIASVFEALKTGKTRLQGWNEASRQNNPFWFWLCVLLQGFIGAVCIATLISGFMS